MDADGEERDAEVPNRRRRFVAWYGEWYMRLYTLLAVVVVVGAAYGYASGRLSWWNAGGMVATLAALSAFIRWRRAVDPAFEGGK